ncbi:MAG: 23S rRNA (guanosine(2251)-2'-O)-methyltransferase RlmB [Desulfobacteraceae bacterium]
MEFLYGFHPVHEALLARRRVIKEIWQVNEGRDGRRAQITELARRRNIKIMDVKAAKLRSHVGAVVHQGIAALAAPLPMTPLTHVAPKASSADSHGHGIWLLLDSIVDPHNLGAIIRTALCIGVKAVILPKDRSASPSPAVSKASAGALEHINLVSVANLSNTINFLKRHGLWVAGLDAHARQNLYDQDLSGAIALVIGGEEKGIRPRVKQQCDFLLSIPQVGKISSLNASVAAGVVMFEAFRQQQNVM